MLPFCACFFSPDIYIRKGDTVDLPCKKRLSPISESVRWYFTASAGNRFKLYTLENYKPQFGPAMEHDRIKMSLNSSLSIRDVRAEDAGVYECCFYSNKSKPCDTVKSVSLFVLQSKFVVLHNNLALHRRLGHGLHCFVMRNHLPTEHLPQIPFYLCPARDLHCFAL